MQQFIENAIQALRNGTAQPESLVRDLRQLNDRLEEVESQYETGPEEEEDLRLGLLQAVRHYQLSLDLLGRYLEDPDPELLERAHEAVVEATFQLDDLATDA